MLHLAIGREKLAAWEETKLRKTAVLSPCEKLRGHDRGVMWCKTMAHVTDKDEWRPDRIVNALMAKQAKMEGLWVTRAIRSLGPFLNQRTASQERLGAKRIGIGRIGEIGIGTMVATGARPM